MKLQLLRHGDPFVLGDGKVSVIEIQDRRLFTRVIRALLSEQGEDADEPYQLWGAKDKPLSPKKAMIVLNSFPLVPFDNKTLISKLYAKVARLIEDDDELKLQLNEMGISIAGQIEDATTGLWGNYAFSTDWALEQHLKAFSFQPVCGDDETLLDNCVRFMGLCVDADQCMPIVMVNAKNFFSSDELERLYSQAVFLDVSLLLLETVHDTTQYGQERKMVIDQDLLVDY